MLDRYGKLPIADRTTTELAQAMLTGTAIPFRMYYTILRACSALLNGDMAIAADLTQCQADAAALGAGSTFGAAVTTMMMARVN